MVLGQFSMMDRSLLGTLSSRARPLFWMTGHARTVIGAAWMAGLACAGLPALAAPARSAPPASTWPATRPARAASARPATATSAPPAPPTSTPPATTTSTGPARAASARSATATSAPPAPPTSTPPARPASARPALPSLRLTEARGSGQPLWRRWVDLDGDGRLDLVVASGSSSAPVASDEGRIEALVAYLRVTPSFLDKRQILVFRQTESGLEPWGSPLPLTGDTTAVDVADLEGDGRPEILFAAGYRLHAFRREGAEGYASPARNLGDVAMTLGYTRSFLPGVRLAAELVKGRPPSLLLPTPSGVELRSLDTDGRLRASPDVLLRSGSRSVTQVKNGVRLDVPDPRVVDADADGSLDLLFQHGDRLVVYRGRGDGTFAAPPLEIDLSSSATHRPGGRRSKQAVRPTSVEDIDGDGLLDLVRTAPPDDGDDGEARDEAGGAEGANDPGAGHPDGGVDGTKGRSENREKDEGTKGAQASLTVEIRLGRPGLAFTQAADRTVAIGPTRKRQGLEARLIKVDGDARADLLITRFSVSVWQIARVLVTKKIAIGISFESMLQRPDGSFAPTAGRPFETKVLFDLKRGISGVPTAPQGDFDGDGITDLVEFSDVPEMKIHLTTPEGVFPERAAWLTRLPRPPEDRALLDIRDIDGDGRSDVVYYNLEGPGFVATVLRSRS